MKVQHKPQNDCMSELKTAWNHRYVVMSRRGILFAAPGRPEKLGNDNSIRMVQLQRLYEYIREPETVNLYLE